MFTWFTLFKQQRPELAETSPAPSAHLQVKVTFSAKWNNSTAPRREDTIAKKHRMTAATMNEDRMSVPKGRACFWLPLTAKWLTFLGQNWICIYLYIIYYYNLITYYILSPVSEHCRFRWTISRSMTTWLSKPIGEDLKWEMLTHHSASLLVESNTVVKTHNSSERFKVVHTTV